MIEIISLTDIDLDRESLKRYQELIQIKDRKDELITRIIEKLSLIEINIVSSHDVENESFSDIAKRLRMNRTSVYKIYMGARLKILEIVKPSGGLTHGLL